MFVPVHLVTTIDLGMGTPSAPTPKMIMHTSRETDNQDEQCSKLKPRVFNIIVIWHKYMRTI